MTTKEATVYIVDVGASMARKRRGRNITDLEWALEYVWDKITTTVATDRKTAFVAVIGLRTDGSQNELDNEEAYQHISILQPLCQTLMSELRSLQSSLQPSRTDDGDAVSALVIAIQMISSHCRKLKYDRKIVLVTNGEGMMDSSDLESITGKIADDGIQLTILGVDFDDAEYGIKEEDKAPEKVANEESLKKLAVDCNGAYGTLSQAIEELSIPRVKTTRPIHSFKGHLTLGNPEDYDTAMAIDVERYPRTLVAKAPSASNFVVRSDMAPNETQSTGTLQNGEASNNDGLAAVKNARTYQVPDEAAPGGKKDVEQDELARGYTYGSTAVYISESDRNVTNYETKAGLDVVGFVARDQYEHFMDMSRSNLIVAQRTNDKASMALSSFIHALYELESYAVARLVLKNDKSPVLLLLAPSIEPDFECLYDVELPYAEDVRSYRFPPLDRIVTVSGKVVKQHRNLPSDALLDAMSDYVDSMDLSTLDKDEEGEPAEYMAIGETFSPTLHRVNQVVRHRAVHPNSEVPAVPPILTKYSTPPSDLLQKAQPSLDRIITAADIKKVPPKVRSRKQRRDASKPLSGLDVDALLNNGTANSARSARISPTNAIPEFKQALSRADSVAGIHDACAQLGVIVRDYIRHSVGASGHGRAIEALRVMREEMNELEEPEQWNKLVKALKKELLGKELGGERVEMWWAIRSNRLGLIKKAECGASEVGEDEAKAFLMAK